MRLENTFEVPQSAEDTWRLLTDLTRLAACLPGVYLDQVVDGRYHGRLSATTGPIAGSYAGTAQFMERDEVAHRAVIVVRGRAEQGSGTVRATMAVSLHPGTTGTRVGLETEIAVSGRAAPVERGVLTAASSSMIRDFAGRLDALIAADTGSAPTPSSAAGAAAAEASADVSRTLVPAAYRVVVPLASAAVGGLIGWLMARWRSRAAYPGERAA